MSRKSGLPTKARALANICCSPPRRGPPTGPTFPASPAPWSITPRRSRGAGAWPASWAGGSGYPAARCPAPTGWGRGWLSGRCATGPAGSPAPTRGDGAADHPEPGSLARPVEADDAGCHSNETFGEQQAPQVDGQLAEPRAISSSSTPALTMAPTLVFSWNRPKPMATTSPSPVRKIRYTGYLSTNPRFTNPSNSEGSVMRRG